jgi:hypothetical protein
VVLGQAYLLHGDVGVTMWQRVGRVKKTDLNLDLPLLPLVKKRVLHVYLPRYLLNSYPTQIPTYRYLTYIAHVDRDFWKAIEALWSRAFVSHTTTYINT